MEPIVSVKDIVDALEMASDEISSFLNKQTGEIVTLTDEELSAAEDEDDVIQRPDWQQEEIIKAREIIDSDDYIQLPTKYEINEYQIIEKFCYSIDDEKIRNILFVSIKGKGAFGRFKDTIRIYEIEDEWYSFRQKELEKIAIDWLEANDIPYIKDES